MADPKTPARWALETCPINAVSGDVSAQERRLDQEEHLLNEGWEPFAVSDGVIWFRKLECN